MILLCIEIRLAICYIKHSRAFIEAARGQGDGSGWRAIEVEVEVEREDGDWRRRGSRGTGWG